MDNFIENIRRYPFVRLLAPLLGGICWQYYLPSTFPFIYLIVSLFIILILLNFSKITTNYHFRWVWGVLLFVLLFAIGCKLTQMQRKNSDLPYKNEVLFTGVVTANPQVKEQSLRLTAKVDAYYDTTNTWHAVNEPIIIYLKNDSGRIAPKAGDRLLCKTTVSPIAEPQNPDEFDYRAYMARHGVFTTAFVNSNRVEVIAENQLPFYSEIPLRIQRFVFNCFKRAGITDNELAVVTALTIGDKQYLNDDIKQSYASAGVIHLLAVSGLHVGIIFMALTFVLSFLTNKKRYSGLIKGLFLLTALWLYAAVVGFSPSVTRATLMFSFLTIGQMWGKQRNTYNFIAASVFVLCVVNPYCIFEVGFQLSYAAVLGIVYFQPKLYQLIYFKHRLPDRLWSVMCVTLAAQLATMPLVLYYFHQFPVYFLPANLVLIFFTTLIIYAALTMIALCWIPFVLTALGWLLGNGLLLLNTSVEWVEALPYALIDGVYSNTTQCFILIGAVLFAAFYWEYRNARVLTAVLALLIVVFGIRLHHKIVIGNQQVITVYSVNKSTFISFVDGRNGYALRDSLHASEYFNYQTKNNLVKQGFASARKLTTYTNCDLLPFSYRNFICFGNKTLYVANSTPIELPKTSDVFIEVDYMVVSQQTKHAPANLLASIRPSLIIIDTSTPTWKALQWVATANEQGIACHWVKNNKAFVD